MNEKVKIVMMECTTGWDTCFCVSMGTNKTDDYSMAVRFGEGELTLDVKDADFAPYLRASPLPTSSRSMWRRTS